MMPSIMAGPATSELPARRRTAARGFRAVEWVLLLFGLAALDTFIWVETSTVLYQAYEDWSFDQALRGSTQSVASFVADEVRTALHRGQNDAEATDEAASQTVAGTRGKSNVMPVSLIGRLEIPRLHLTAIVREGADSSTLQRAVGHIPGTALPGNTGNVALAGHRDTFFRALKAIKKDDDIEVQTVNGTYHYIVDSTTIVAPRDVSVLAASRYRTLTLVTCYPFYYVGSAPKRFIVRASQVTALPGMVTPRQPQPGS